MLGSVTHLACADGAGHAGGSLPAVEEGWVESV